MPKLKPLVIIIRGAHDTGKTTVASLIKMFLEENGFRYVTVEDLPEPTAQPRPSVVTVPLNAQPAPSEPPGAAMTGYVSEALAKTSQFCYESHRRECADAARRDQQPLLERIAALEAELAQTEPLPASEKPAFMDRFMRNRERPIQIKVEPCEEET